MEYGLFELVALNIFLVIVIGIVVNLFHGWGRRKTDERG